jgi:hypothetical protein
MLLVFSIFIMLFMSFVFALLFVYVSNIVLAMLIM